MTNTVSDHRQLPILLQTDVVDDPRLSVYDLAVYLVILRYAAIGGGNTAFPSIRTMSKRLGIASSTVQRSLTHLIDLRYIKKRTRTRRGSSAKMSNHYTILDVPSHDTGVPSGSTGVPSGNTRFSGKGVPPGSTYKDITEKDIYSSTSPSVSDGSRFITGKYSEWIEH